MNIRTIISILLVVGVQTQDPKCCHDISSHPECQEVCDQMALESTQSGRQRHFARLRSNCPMTLETFWQCVNSTLAHVFWLEDTRWFGQRCCSEAQQDECRHDCLQAHSMSDLADSCLPDVEESFIACLRRYERQQHCCNQAPIGSQCWSKCQGMFEVNYPSSEDEVTMQNYCIREQNVVACVSNYTASLPVKDPTDSIHCCDEAGDDNCRETCHHVLQTYVKDSDIMDGLMETCGPPLPQHPLWKCFIRNSGNTNLNDNALIGNVAALDGARLQCCSQAFSLECKDLCRKLYTTDWGSWDEFKFHCKDQPKEARLLRCIDDVQTPCQLGCSGLDYCQNFNGRPTEFFRSCTSQSDDGAEGYITEWQAGTINLQSLQTAISVLDITECLPDMWKAIACTLQIKPCHSKSHTNLICKSDCITILSKCLDYSRLDAYQTPESLCTMLSPSDDSAPCLSLQNYLAPSSHGERMHEVNVPCHSNPCSNETAKLNQLCQINRHTCDYNDVCYDYSCASGCKLGGASKFLVPHGSYVKIPDLDSVQPDCFKICRCGSNNMLEDCDSVLCVNSLKCKEGGQIKDHHTHFHVDCNICSCYAGDLICSLRQCLSEESTDEERRRFTGLPCDSPDELIPVCGRNGRTYPNAHIARCVGFTDDHFQIGSCSSKEPCSLNPCEAGQQCIPKRQTCLGTKFCPQYVCVLSSVSCAGEVHEPVCDTEGREHPNICTLYRRGKRLAYRGRCQRACSEELSVTVCGQNGETFSNKCAAWSQRVTIDYHGPCQAVGFLSDDNDTARCARVKCPSWDSASCRGFVPPGACCPICAGQLRVLYSSQIADDLASILRQPISLDTVLMELRRHISVAECDLYGYLSIEADIVVLVVPIVGNPTNLQVDACNKEALKLAALINSGSPLVSSFVHLSILTAAFTTTSEIQTVSGSPNLQNSYFILIVQSIFLLSFYFLHWKR